MTDAELRHDAARLTARGRALKFSSKLLPFGAPIFFLCSFAGVAAGLSALALPSVLAVGAYTAGCALCLAVSIKGENECRGAAGDLQDRYCEQLKKVSDERQRRAVRSPALLAMVKKTHVAKSGWKRNILSAAADKAFHGGTDKPLKVGRPLKLAAAP